MAGVQKLLRQHSSLVPFFQTNSEELLRQLSMDCAPAAVASAAVANNIATLFSFFIFLLSETKPQRRCEVLGASGDHHPKHEMYCAIRRRGFKRGQDRLV